MAAGDAIAKIRCMRPGSIESETQEKLVHAWVGHRWKTVSVPLEMPQASFEMSGNYKPSNKTCIVLVGLPGSGKSWLATALKRRDESFDMISQDVYSKSQCLTLFAKSSRCVIDRCNVAAIQRSPWIKSDADNVAVVFCHNAAFCQQQISYRIGHPTVRYGARAVREHASEWEDVKLT